MIELSILPLFEKKLINLPKKVFIAMNANTEQNINKLFANSNTLQTWQCIQLWVASKIINQTQYIQLLQKFCSFFYVCFAF